MAGSSRRREAGYVEDDGKSYSPTSMGDRRPRCKLDLSVLDNPVTFTAPTVNHVGARLTRFVVHVSREEALGANSTHGSKESSLFIYLSIDVSIYTICQKFSIIPSKFDLSIVIYK